MYIKVLLVKSMFGTTCSTFLYNFWQKRDLLIIVNFCVCVAARNEENFDEKEENDRKRHALREEEEERDRHVWATRSTSERVDEHREWPERVSLVRVQRQQSEKEGEQND